MGKQKTKKQKYYAIKEGKGVTNKIVRSWGECEKLVKGYPAVYKSFVTEEEAFKYLGTVEVNKVKEQAKHCMEKKKKLRATTKVLNVRLEKELIEGFEAKCEEMGLTKELAIKGMLEEWIL